MIYLEVLTFNIVGVVILSSVFAWIAYDVFETLNRLIVYGRKPKKRK
jgi:hypothetical protein